jgi:hypothetical protein
MFVCVQAVLLEGKAWQSRADELAGQLAAQQQAAEVAAAAAGGGCVLRGPEADAAAERDIGDLEALIGEKCRGCVGLGSGRVPLVSTLRVLLCLSPCFRPAGYF